MTLAELMIKISCDTSEAEKGINQTEQKTSKLGSTMGKVAKVVGGAFVAAGTAVGKFALDATKAYANYEQLVGGVETLFGAGGKSLKEYQKQLGVTAKSIAMTMEETSLFRPGGSSDKEISASIESYNKLIAAQNEVMNNAKQAYKTAGMDMNSYMETVTSFSASLIQSLGGDTLAAAKAADQAIVDMSDNANKMGTDMASIENAYKGFSKQNYTMLDNLKLGYGGTRSEMQRLLKDAQKITGKKYDLKNLNDVYEAIHVIQTELGITGTTAKEASTTIQGSLGMMKASWMNLKLAIADPNGNVGEAITQLVDSAKTFAKNAAPIFGQALRGIGSVIKELAPIISNELPNLIGDLLPDLIDAAGNLVAGLVDGIIKNAPMIIDGFGQILQKVGASLEASDNPIFSAFGKLISGIGSFIRDPKNAINEAWGWVLENIFGVDHEIAVQWAQEGWELLKTSFDEAIKWLGKAWKTTVNWVQNAWEAVSNALSEAGAWIGQAWDTTVNWINQAWTDVSNAFKDAGEWVQKTWNTTVNWINQAWTDLQSAFNEAANWANQTFQTIFQFMEQGAAAVKQLIDELAKPVQKVIQIAVQGPGKQIAEKVGEVTGAGSQIAGDLWGFLTGNIFGHAKGDWAVPYDNYPALLHRNEMVLTASQARQYREGGMNMDFSSLADAIASAVRQGMSGATVNSYLDGKLVSDEVSRMLGSDMTARRFA